MLTHKLTLFKVVLGGVNCSASDDATASCFIVVVMEYCQGISGQGGGVVVSPVWT